MGKKKILQDKEDVSMKGFKAFNKDLTCRGFQYEIGQVYEMDGKPVCCKNGFHFCKNLADVYRFYDMSDDTRICIVEALGEFVTDDNIKYCTNKIKIVEEITDRMIKHCNVNDTSTGFYNTGNCNVGNRNVGGYNTGNYNAGDYNTGYCNTGDYNAGDYNTGNRNTGYYNTGDYNAGNRNIGNYNTGYYNTGNHNTGDYNAGNRNIGNYNIGNYNTGYYNAGNYNAGDYNAGNCNTGDYNTGNRNTGGYNAGNCNAGDYNAGDYNTGYCNTTNAKVRLFNHYTDFCFNSTEIRRLRNILSSIPISSKYTEFIDDCDMTEKEIEEHPEYKTIGGYLKVVDEKADVKKWWDELNENDREFIQSLPHYDEKVFFECIGLEEE